MSNNTVRIVSRDITVTASSAYTAGDQIGGKIAISIPSTAGSGIIGSAFILDKADQQIQADLFLFRRNPTATSFADKAALTLNDSDLFLLANVIKFVSGESSSLAANGVVGKTSISVPYQCEDAQDSSGNFVLYGVLIARSTPTFASTSDLRLVLGILEDK